MGAYIANLIVKKMIAAGKDPHVTRVLVMGATFKENVSDIRNSKVADVIAELKSFSVNVEVVDSYADSDELQHEYGFPFWINPVQDMMLLLWPLTTSNTCT
ncbi:MAG: hypothetical protein M0D57_04100 [Sphingobacteriales bacterium JAD_PAG50586_3]|nr:MAG: hypothetical protein M0D57_04100 [Sphingobacteriales bacterium JAD_PAG50586_3]